MATRAQYRHGGRTSGALLSDLDGFSEHFAMFDTWVMAAPTILKFLGR
jgi:hypothetical protein